MTENTGDEAKPKDQISVTPGKEERVPPSALERPKDAPKGPEPPNNQGQSASGRSAAVKLLFEKAYDAYQQDNERYWKMFNYMTLINGALLGVVVAVGAPGTVLAAVGAAFCLIWAGLQRRYAWWCDWWGEELARLEIFLLWPEDAWKGTEEHWQKRRDFFLWRPGVLASTAKWFKRWRDPGDIGRSLWVWVVGGGPPKPTSASVCSDNAEGDVLVGLPHPFHRHHNPRVKPKGFSTKRATIGVPLVFACAWALFAWRPSLLPQRPSSASTGSALVTPPNANPSLSPPPSPTATPAPSRIPEASAVAPASTVISSASSPDQQAKRPGKP